MDTIYSGAGIFWIEGFIALFMLSLVTLFKPVLPIAPSITLLITGYLCISVGASRSTTPPPWVWPAPWVWYWRSTAPPGAWPPA